MEADSPGNFYRPPAADPLYHLIRQPDGCIDLARGALLIARDASPDLDISSCLRRIRGLASEVDPRLKGLGPREAVAELSRFLAVEQGFRGNADRFDDPRNSYLNDVLDRRLGIPITLSILYIAVGRQAGLPLAGINFPGRFLVRCAAVPDPVFVDPYTSGRVIGRAELVMILERMMGKGAVLDDSLLVEAAPAHIFARMLRNLRRIHAGRGDFERAVSAGERIAWLQPETASDHRDLGYLYWRLGAFHRGLCCLDEYLRRSPGAEDAKTIANDIALLQSQLAVLN